MKRSGGRWRCSYCHSPALPATWCLGVLATAAGHLAVPKTGPGSVAVELRSARQSFSSVGFFVLFYFLFSGSNHPTALLSDDDATSLSEMRRHLVLGVFFVLCLAPHHSSLTGLQTQLGFLAFFRRTCTLFPQAIVHKSKCMACTPAKPSSRFTSQAFQLAPHHHFSRERNAGCPFSYWIGH